MLRSFACLLLALSLLVPSAQAEDVAPLTEERWVQAALEEAGENRAELEQVLTHFAKDPRRLEAARFLIANMPGKGYITTELRDTEGKVISYDPLAYPDFKAALAALDEIQAKHGEVDFARDKKIEDLKTVKAAFLIKHIDLSFRAWHRMAPSQRVGFAAFLHHVLPYRGSQEPVDDWLEPLMQRYAGRLKAVANDKLDAKGLYAWLSKDIHKRLRFNERYYLHPTDQSFTEMGRSGQGRCEDITNMITFAARSLALATAADYTPYWAHRDNNHAWNVLLDKDGRGFDRGQSHAAKVYRKTFAIQRESLPFQLEEGREPPNRFMASTTAMDVTDQYMETTQVDVVLDPAVAKEERHAYLCVFNGGEWKAIHWSPIREGKAAFDRMGRGILYLPCVHDGEKLVAAGAPVLAGHEGQVTALPGSDDARSVIAVAVSPKKISPDTFEETPVNYLKAGETYVLKRWDHASRDWRDVRELKAGEKAPRFENLPVDGLYWLVQKDGKPRRLERPWTIGPGGFQRFW
ncbi:MAG: transglutaminase domain-containing protein [Planctomycetota bacterium]|nr:transglutaminase domain-containing protein [Planctomycetota bacterium]